MPQLTRTQANVVNQVCLVAYYPCSKGDTLLCDLGAWKHMDNKIQPLMSLKDQKVLIFWHQSIKPSFGDMFFTSASFRYILRAVFIMKIYIIWKTLFSIFLCRVLVYQLWPMKALSCEESEEIRVSDPALLLTDFVFSDQSGLLNFCFFSYKTQDFKLLICNYSCGFLIA